MVRRADSYATILKLRTVLRDRCAVDVAAATLDVGARLRVHEAVDAETSHETTLQRDELEAGEVDRAALLQFSDYHSAQQETRAKSAANLAEASAALASCRSALSQADVAVRIVQSLRDRKLLAERTRRSRCERIELEDRTGGFQCG